MNDVILTEEHVSAILAMLLEYGWGELRVVVQNRRIWTIHPEFCVKSPTDAQLVLTEKESS